MTAEDKMRAEIQSFDEFINEPPAYESERRVREYRHLLYPRWTQVTGAVKIYTAKSAETIARLEVENSRLKQVYQYECEIRSQRGEMLLERDRKLAAAELSNKQLREHAVESIHAAYRYGTQNFGSCFRQELEEFLAAQQPSTEALDAYVSDHVKAYMAGHMESFDVVMKEKKELQAKVDALKWQPIETAPKDGTKILLARIGKNEAGKDLGIWWVCKGYWSSKWNNWNDGIEPSGLAKPTHWMPLPPSPNTQGVE